MNSQQPQNQILSVSQLNRRARQLLETHLSLIWVRGEISNLTRPSSGHWYFTLKDQDAQVRCAMFRNRNAQVTFRPRDGQQVLVRGRVSLYENRGDYQLLAEHLQADGAGQLAQLFEELKTRLGAEGLFDQAKKKILPTIPSRIGVVTSPTGAAIRDIVQVLQRRLPMVPITVYPASVQGATAAGEIVKAIAAANRHDRCDVLIVGRGGGSLEDLWPFNEESVARAIAASAIPVISAVGHETDFTIADFVADLRAPTPSAAAELAAPDRVELAARLDRSRKALERDLQRLVDSHRQRLDSLRQRLRNPADRLREQAQHLDHLEIRLHSSLDRLWRGKLHQMQQLQKRLEVAKPARKLALGNHRLALLRNRLITASRKHLASAQLQLVRLSSTLDGVSPLNTLHRGYAIAYRDDGAAPQRPLLRSINEVQPGSRLVLTISDGSLGCTVNRVLARGPTAASRPSGDGDTPREADR